MIILFRKILVFSLFFLLVPIFLQASPDFNSQTYGQSEVPVILPRSIWENSADLKNLFDWYPEENPLENQEESSPPDYFSVDRIIIHDMGCDIRRPGCNDKKLSPITIIQNIYRYHAVTRGWGDIGYHYIIDYWGNIYEGRYGGNGVRGAHTYYDKKCDNFNVGSIGILLMGNYEKAELSEIMYKSLIRLVAWLASVNGLNPAELNHTSEIWHSPNLPRRQAGKGFDCDISQGGLTSTYTGPIIIGHRDVEEGNSDPGLVDLKRVRQEAVKLFLKYKNYVYAVQGDSKVYSISNGIRKELSSFEEPSSLKISLNKNQFYAFSSKLKKRYPDGTLVKSDTRDRIYYIEKNKRRPILSEKLFKLKKFDWSDVQLLPDRELAKYSLAKPLTYPDGVLIKSQGPEIYLVKNGKRKHISSAILFNKMGFDWKDVILVSQAELSAHPLGEKVLFPDGTLIKEEESPPVYLVKNQKRHWIKTLTAFLGLGYKWKDVINLPQSEGLDGEPNIRVGIYQVPAGKSVKIRASGPYEIYKNDILLASKKSGEITIIPYSKADFYKFLPVSESVIFEIISYQDRPKWNQRLNDNLFRGKLEIKYSSKSKRVWIINELPLEDYLKGVAEALNDDPIEYLKAFVVAARSYALFHINNGGKRPGEIFHLRNWAYDQLYKGYGFEKRAPNIAKAVEETRGVIAVFNGEPIRGVYSSDSGGVTKSACQVFKGIFCHNKDYEYLKELQLLVMGLA